MSSSYERSVSSNILKEQSTKDDLELSNKEYLLPTNCRVNYIVNNRHSFYKQYCESHIITIGDLILCRDKSTNSVLTVVNIEQIGTKYYKVYLEYLPIIESLSYRF